MRCTSIVAGVVLAGSVLVAGPALAGGPWSDDCADGRTLDSGNETPVLNGPVTVGAETGTSGPVYAQACYSSTAVGDITGLQLVGGRTEVMVTPDPHLHCATDDNPTLVHVDCTKDDPEPASVGFTETVSVSVQSTTVSTGRNGAEAGVLGSPACLDGTTVYVLGGTIGPYDVGVCP